jgi:molecular chaperone DnaK (HSP70)
LPRSQDRACGLAAGDSVLVVDIGGGTTDLTASVLEEREGDIVLTESIQRSGLLLGATNIDDAFESFYGHQPTTPGSQKPHLPRPAPTRRWSARPSCR